ncbi:MAG: lysine transporter LysE [Altibacter sp.]|uniref:lysine transporter LysE n=1 Tax=Altibacter sp. TaxID=2024823 RepID=UPI001E059BBF|nr:lysine transporter LysE [Altibacter sp.]MBZ0326700.1 lysine transporter LysE [Altibacter sp.]
MSLILNFTIGFLASLVGVIPPGLLNMSAAKISMVEGRKKGLLFSVGVCVTVMIQTFVALNFARYIDRHPEVVDTLQKIALGIFICISIYFFFIAKDTRREMPEEVEKSKTSRFFSGMFLAALNLLPLPYWVYVSITFSGFGWFKFTQPELWAAVVASGVGTFAMLIIYVQYFRKKEDRGRLKINMNYIIGLITAVISIITAIKILNDF